MKLADLIKAVNEKGLTKTQLEEYRDDMANVYALMQLELAEIRKEKALYWLGDNKKETDIATERAWAASARGQREIELAHYCKATEKILSSLKSRLYSTY
jgi:hypothetical protein